MEKKCRNTLKKAIKRGMKNAFIDMIWFSDNPRDLIGAEYLITVNIAKAIAINLNTRSIAYSYKVYLEQSIEEFSNHCVPETIETETNNGSEREILGRTGGHNKGNKGRIDIAVYKDIPTNTNRFVNIESKTPYCAIEVKSCNANKSKILNDLKRNLKYFTFSDDTTGYSRIEYTVFAALHSYDNKLTKKNVRKRKKKLKDKYDQYLKELNLSESIEKHIWVFKIEGEALNQSKTYSMLQLEDLRQRMDDPLILGVIVMFNKKDHYQK